MVKHTAESKRRLLAKCNASRRQIVNFFRNLSKYRLKKSQNVQFMSNEGVHGTIVPLTNLHTWNLHGKVYYISQTSENSFGTQPQNWPRFHSNVIFLNLFAYKSSIMIDYVTLSLFYATDVSFFCLMTCVDNKPLKRCKISVARLLEHCEDAYWCKVLCIILVVLIGLYGYISY